MERSEKDYSLNTESKNCSLELKSKTLCCTSYLSPKINFLYQQPTTFYTCFLYKECQHFFLTVKQMNSVSEKSIFNGKISGILSSYQIFASPTYWNWITSRSLPLDEKNIDKPNSKLKSFSVADTLKMYYILTLYNNVLCLFKFVDLTWIRKFVFRNMKQIIQFTFPNPQYLCSVKLISLIYHLSRPVSETLGLVTTSKNRAL